MKQDNALTPTPVHIRLRHLHCHRASSRWRATQPYLWNIFFRIDGSCVHLTEQFDLVGKADFFFSPGSHGNLGVDTVTPGSVTVIPPEVGHWDCTLSPIPVPFFAYQVPPLLGIITVLMEQENVSAAGAEAGHQALNRYVQAAVNEAIRDFHVREIDVENIHDSIKAYFARRVASFVEGIEVAIIRAVREAQTLWQNLWALIDQDDLVGYHIRDLSLQELSAADGHIALTPRWNTANCGDWELQGHVELGPDTSPQPRQVEIEE